MSKIIQGLLVGLVGLGLASGVSAQERASKDEALKVVKDAIKMCQDKGAEAVIEEANKPETKFKFKDSYLFIYDKDGVNKSHVNPKMIGKNLLEMRDADGKYLNKNFIEIGNKGGGWQDYRWPNSVSKAVEAKSSYVEKCKDHYFIAGFYLPTK
jgi:signal transduction histidine kinase